MSAFHQDLRIGRYLPPISMGPRLTALANRIPAKPGAPPDDIVVEDMEVPGPSGAPAVAVRSYRSRDVSGTTPALLWLHGGGMITGNHYRDANVNIAFARSLGITVVSVRYRLAPRHRAPAAVEDAYAALHWMHTRADDLGIAPDRLALGGESSGGGLAAGLAQMAVDRGEIKPAFQLLVYPMLDDRTVLRSDMNVKNVRVWTPGSNRYAWTSYLGRPPGHEEPPPYAAPARRKSLAGLPPAWIGVGDLDLFYEEDVHYAERLRASGVPCSLEVVHGAFHGFYLLFPRKHVSRQFWRSQASALRTALFPAS